MAGVEGIQVDKGGLLGPGVPNVRQVFVHIGYHYWLRMRRGLVSTPSEEMNDFLGKKNISYKYDGAQFYSNSSTSTITAVTPCKSAVALLLSQMCSKNHFEREKVV